MAKILWVSRHSPLPSQVEALKKLYGEGLRIQTLGPDGLSVEVIVARYREGGFRDLVCVVPLSILERLTRLGIHPLITRMRRVPLAQAELVKGGVGYKFQGYKRVRSYWLELEDPLAN